MSGSSDKESIRALGSADTCSDSAQISEEATALSSACDSSEHEHEQSISGPSAFASALDALKRDTLEAVNKRKRVPQPLFWSLFHARLAELKEQKKAVRELEAVFGVKLD